MRKQFGFIGCGNMGGTLARLVAEKVGGDKVAVADFDSAKTKAIADQFGTSVTTAEEIASSCHFVVLGVKPQALDSVFATLAAALEKLTDRERKIMYLRFGLHGGEEMTQKDVADLLGISQSYISRLEKKIILRLKKEIGKME